MPSDSIWAGKYLPDTTDNYVPSEIFVKGITSQQVWAKLANITKWEAYYGNVGQTTPPKSGAIRQKDDLFSFSTFGFPPLQSQVFESVPPAEMTPGRLAWRAWQEGDEDQFLDVYHAWIVEDVPRGVFRILTQELQIGTPAAQLSTAKPNPMLNGHQDWRNGLTKAAKEKAQGPRPRQ